MSRRCRRPERAGRARRARRHRQRLPGPARPAVDGPGLPRPRPVGGVITHDTSYVFEPGFPTTDERLINLRPVTRREAYEADITYGTNNEFGFDYLRDNMVDELEQPGAARAGLRDRRRGRQHPHRRGADAADHLRPGRGVGRPVLHVRPAGAAAPAAARGRRGGRRLLRRPQGQGGRADRGGHRQDRAAARHRRTCTTPTCGSPAISTRRSRPTRCTSATATTSSRTARSSSSTSSPAARCPAGAGARACTRRSRRRRACGSSGRAARWRRSRSRTTSGCTTSSPA